MLPWRRRTISENRASQQIDQGLLTFAIIIMYTKRNRSNYDHSPARPGKEKLKYALNSFPYTTNFKSFKTFTVKTFKSWSMNQRLSLTLSYTATFCNNLRSRNQFQFKWCAADKTFKATCIPSYSQELKKLKACDYYWHPWEYLMAIKIAHLRSLKFYKSLRLSHHLSTCDTN